MGYSFSSYIRPIAMVLLLTGQAERSDAVPITYKENVFNVTGLPGTEIGLGSTVYSSGLVSLAFTFVGDTNNVTAFTINGTSGYINTTGTATVTVTQFDIQTGTSQAETATFAQNEVYVGTDTTNQGIGFGSRIFPIYPYALFGNPLIGIDLNQPQYDLRHNASLTYSALSCVWPPDGGPCLNQPGVASSYVLMTDKGGFWVTTQGPTHASFTSTLSPVPEPNSVLQIFAGLIFIVSCRRRRAGARFVHHGLEH